MLRLVLAVGFLYHSSEILSRDIETMFLTAGSVFQSPIISLSLCSSAAFCL